MNLLIDEKIDGIVLEIDLLKYFASNSKECNVKII